jgi:BirA family transcriptional regulator, biotin operon repressor / biotin---[acetyl-CoA-carboxylase] ligase
LHGTNADGKLVKIVIDIPRLLAETDLQKAEWFEEVDSTNNRALDIAIQPILQMPYLVGAENQQSGRGRGTNRWWGSDGSLMFSVVVDMGNLGLSPIDWPRFSLVTGLAIASTLTFFVPGIAVGLKWPNDVWLQGRKVCGILIEQCDRYPDRLIVGIGLNVNNSFALAPDELQTIATSMTDSANGANFSRTDVLIRFLNEWKTLTGHIAEGSINLVERWSRACVLSGHPVKITNGNQIAIGVCAGIDSDGALLLRTAFSVEKHYAGTARILE